MATPTKIKKRMVRGQPRWVIDLRGKTGEGKRAFFKEKTAAEEFVRARKLKLNPDDPPLILIGKEKRDYLAAKDILDGRYSMVEAAHICIKTEKVLRPENLFNAIGLCEEAKERSGKGDHYLRVFRARLKSFAKISEREFCHNATAADIESWLHSRGWEPATKRGALIDLRTFFNFCLKRSWVMLNPCAGVEPIVVSEYAKGILTPKQADILIRTCVEKEKRMVRYFVDQLFGGLREDEARTLEKSFEHALHIELPETKTNQPGFIEWNDTWMAWREKYPGDYGMIKNFIRRIKKVKVAAKVKMAEAGLVAADFWFPKNCLRHSFCSYGSKIWGTGKTAELARHSEAMQKKHYRRPIPLEDAKSFWAILP